MRSDEESFFEDKGCCSIDTDSFKQHIKRMPSNCNIWPNSGAGIKPVKLKPSIERKSSKTTRSGRDKKTPESKVKRKYTRF